MSKSMQEMRLIKDSQMQQQQQDEKQKQQDQTKVDELKKQVQLFCDGLIQNWLKEDHRLFSKKVQSGTDGFVIGFQTLQQEKLQTFNVQVVCKINEIEVSVSDGYWEKKQGFLGNWGDWTDQIIVYKGVFEEKTLSMILENQFLTWYRRVME